jgi:hypothetical protein
VASPGAPHLVEVDRSVQRVTRGLVRPRIARGRVRQGTAISGTAWDWKLRVDTAAARFDSASPFYFARLLDHPFLGDTSAFRPLFARTPAKVMRTLLGPYVAIEAAGRTSFWLHVRSGASRADFPSFTAEAALPWEQGLPVAVDWFGIDTERAVTEAGLADVDGGSS